MEEAPQVTAEPSEALAAPSSAGVSASGGSADNGPAEEPVQDDGDEVKVLVDSVSEEQRERYWARKKATIPAAAVEKCLKSITGKRPSDQLKVAMCGITKVFVSELVETARRLQSEAGLNGPIQPKFYTQAHAMVIQAPDYPGKRVPGNRLFQRRG